MSLAVSHLDFVDFLFIHSTSLRREVASHLKKLELQQKFKARIAVVGGGVSGIACLWDYVTLIINFPL